MSTTNINVRSVFIKEWKAEPNLHAAAEYRRPLFLFYMAYKLMLEQPNMLDLSRAQPPLWGPNAFTSASSTTLGTQSPKQHPLTNIFSNKTNFAVLTSAFSVHMLKTVNLATRRGKIPHGHNHTRNDYYWKRNMLNKDNGTE